jgi:hypothetical protein
MWDLYPLSPSSYAKELPAPFWHWGVCVSVWGGGGSYAASCTGGANSEGGVYVYVCVCACVCVCVRVCVCVCECV